MAGTKGKRPTIRQVADAAGVARSTVSRAFSHPERLTQQTVERIMEISKNLGYTPNSVAIALSTGRSSNIALIVPDVANPFFPPLIRAAQRKAEERGYSVFLGDTDENQNREVKLLERFSGKVEGIILVSSRLSDDVISELAKNVSVVLINRDVDRVPRVLIDSAAGVTDAVNLLHSQGHKDVAYVSGPKTSWANSQRRNAARRATKAHGMTLHSVPASMSSYDAGRRTAAKLVRSGATACIAFDDLLAQGILAEMDARGIKVPEQISVVGCDDVLGSTTRPALTTVSNCCVSAGEIAVSTLLDALDANEHRDSRHVLGTHLVIRESAGRPTEPVNLSD